MKDEQVVDYSSFVLLITDLPMLKLLICVVCSLVIGAIALQLRQQQLDLRHRILTLQGQIEKHQARLWSQQMQISVHTSPRAVIKTLNKDMALGPESVIPAEAGNWVREDTD